MATLKVVSVPWELPTACYPSATQSDSAGAKQSISKLGGAVPEYFEENFHRYRQYIDADQNSKAVEAALDFLAERKAADSAQYTADHKGSPFYVLGYAAFASHDYPSASLYFDAAVAADLTYHRGNHNTSALRFMQLLTDEGEPLLARNNIAAMIVSTEKLLDDYRNRPGAQPITLNEIRNRFLCKIITTGAAPQRALVTALLSFVAEWPYRAKQIELVEAGSREPFFLHILRGCILFESLLKAAPGTPRLNTLGSALHHHATTLAINPANIATSETDFNNVLVSLRLLMPMEDTINTCAKSRNTVGHNLVWATSDLTPQNYNLLVKNVAASCVHAISKLYP
jgi:hypothetical protein